VLAATTAIPTFIKMREYRQNVEIVIAATIVVITAAIISVFNSARINYSALHIV